MKKIRYCLAAIALVAALGGFYVQGLGSVANAASIHHASSAFVAGQLASSGSPHIYGPCLHPGYDC